MIADKISAVALILIAAVAVVMMWRYGVATDYAVLHDNTIQTAIAQGYHGDPASKEAWDLFHNSN
ncbi:MAG TPA: hypothetical protein VFE87_00095 [Candidatus Paceibacterota bacterium]|nr:hypothetical protein [Candidatus Paceibacterota bacterium]